VKTINPSIIINMLAVPKMGRRRTRQLMAHFGPEVNPFDLSVKELCAVKGISKDIARSIKSYSRFELGEAEVEAACQKKITLITCWNKHYPVLLKKIYDPPILLYCTGQPLQAREDTIAIVGTRRYTAYGKSVTQSITRDLNLAGLTIVSGLARGIDTIAHQETVRNGCRTIAVLGTGLDVLYPPENRQLASQICERGTIITEFPLSTGPERGNFPQRNRIIAGLAHAVLVSEAGHRSGAMLTALDAVDQNRDVFAIPGRVVDKQSVGTNRLIRNGAVPVATGEEIIQAINPKLFNPLQRVQKKLSVELSEAEQKIMENLGSDPVHIDQLANQMEMEITSLLQQLLSLELKNAVQQVGGKQFVRA